MLIAKHACLCPCNATMLRDSDTMFKLMMHMLNNHDNNGLLRGMIAGPMQCNDGLLYANETVHVI